MTPPRTDEPALRAGRIMESVRTRPEMYALNAETLAAFAHHGVVALGQAQDELVRVHGLYKWEVHPNDSGSDLIASTIAECLLNSGLLAPR